MNDRWEGRPWRLVHTNLRVPHLELFEAMVIEF